MEWLKSSEVAKLMGYSLHYFRNDIAVCPNFPKPRRRKNARGGLTQPRYLAEEIHEYLVKI